MARSISQIKAQIAETYISDPTVREAYGITKDRSFDSLFSPVSVESVIFHVVASCIWVLEKMFDRHSADVGQAIESLRPHTLRWYCSMAMRYMRGRDLIMADGVAATDSYDLTDLSDDEIQAARVVRYAVASEDTTGIYIKVAGADSDGRPCQLDPDDHKGLIHYMSQIKDAGVRVTVLNDPADLIRVKLMVLYDPAILTATHLSPKGLDSMADISLRDADDADVIAQAVTGVVSRLPFNGEYRNSDLLAAVKAVPGVRVADIISVEAAPGGTDNFSRVVGFRRPASGYYRLDTLDVHGRSYTSDDNV